MRTLVGFKPIGRLGNIMFQTAAAVGYAKKYNVDWCAPMGGYETKRFLEYFPRVKGKASHDNFRRYEEHPHGRDNWFDYHEIPFNPNGVTLVGFWQSLKYFEHCQDYIKYLFELPKHDLNDFCSIHVRRGDYVVHNTNFPPITMEYISKAMFEQASRGNTKFIVFSDDIEWCKRNINGDYEIRFSEGKGEIEDMSMMASCGHNIIANSSFSWWGAYLNPNPDKVIFSPSQEGNNWFGPDWDNKNPNKPKTLIPNDWHQITFR